MPAVSASIVVSAPVDKVWATVGDLNTQPEWNTVHAGFPKGLPESLAENTEFIQTIKQMGMPNDIEWTVSALEPERVLELTGKAPMNVSVRMRYELAAADGGTRVTIENEFKGAMIKLMAGQLKKGAQVELDASIANLKAIVE